ncbi:alpha/beta hydrolase [Kribbella sp. NBC_00889]|uniref:alpha/beta hydrolase n=1 Tax=Kribbella sp. NBC_00889 TaxID=2975974 RepID=UPI003863948D|nr:alpha/beta fold hydrolase [Kribbella sp. NBC_00889]
MERAGARPRIVGASLLFCAGCLVLGVGIGLGPPYLAKAGIHPVTFIGIAVLAAGLVLLALGGVALVRLARSWRRILVVPVLLAMLATATLSVGQAVAATNVPPTTVGSITPADRGLTFAEVTFPTADGVVLAGWYIPSRNHAAVVLLHGAGSTRSSPLDHAVVLARHGYGVLLVDARGHGRSHGRAMDFGWYGDQDVAAAVSFLQTRPDVDDDLIAAAGLSMGGEEAIGAAAGDRRIRAVVAEGATHRVAADRAWLSDEYGWRGTLQEGLDRLTYSITGLLTGADPPRTLRDTVDATAPRKVLLIAADDRADEGNAGRYIQSAATGNVDLWIVPGTGHTDALRTHPREWEQRVTAFLSTALDLEGNKVSP